MEKDDKVMERGKIGKKTRGRKIREVERKKEKI